MKVEGIDDVAGLHPVQQALVGDWAFQCGYYLPGVLMSMHSDHSSLSLSLIDIEDAVLGCVCRRTGYQPILDADESGRGPTMGTSPQPLRRARRPRRTRLENAANLSQSTQIRVYRPRHLEDLQHLRYAHPYAIMLPWSLSSQAPQKLHGNTSFRLHLIFASGDDA